MNLRGFRRQLSRLRRAKLPRGGAELPARAAADSGRRKFADRKWSASPRRQVVASCSWMKPDDSGLHNVGRLISLTVPFLVLLLAIQAATCRQLYRVDIPAPKASDQQDHNHHRNYQREQQPSTGSVAMYESEKVISSSQAASDVPVAMGLQGPADTISDMSSSSGGGQLAPQSATAAAATETSSPMPTSEDMKLPLYMRILATLACLIIFTIGVCGNLLVPLVVIKTKYLRNSTNLFLINLSVADLLVLIVCMPTVLIELHSRPETWLLGEPMCKLSNFVEMLAANGSIFTILAISFERYYAICKPLKAGYKCTRLRATIIICLIWVLSSILTSPILIMAKSSETIYIDGSLVYNCILETDTYWHKMYVFVSMIAFFCLPLIVLMLVYWLIGRRLIRENLAMRTTTSLATTTANYTAAAIDSAVESSQATCEGYQPTNGHNHNSPPSFGQPSAIYVARKRVGGGLRKASSLKSISASLFSLLQQRQQQHDNLRPVGPRQPSDGQQNTRANCTGELETDHRPSTRLGHIRASLAGRRSLEQRGRRRPSASRAARSGSGPAEAQNLAADCLLSGEEPVQPETVLNTRAASYQSGTKLAVANGTADNVVVAAHGDSDLIAAAAGAGKRGNNVSPLRRSLANQFVHHLFHIKSNRRPPMTANGSCNGTKLISHESCSSKTGDMIGRGNSNMGINGCQVGRQSKPTSGWQRRRRRRPTVNEMQGDAGNRYPDTDHLGRQGYDNDNDGDDEPFSYPGSPFIATNSPAKLSAACDKRLERGGGRRASNLETANGSEKRKVSSTLSATNRPRPTSRGFYWTKRFSISSSSAASMQTNFTNLPSEVSSAGDQPTLPNLSPHTTNKPTAVQASSPRPIIHFAHGAGSGFRDPACGRPPRASSSAKKCAHFSVDTTDNSSPTPPPTCSSAGESSSSGSASSSSASSATSYSSKTPSPLEQSLEHSPSLARRQPAAGYLEHNNCLLSKRFSGGSNGRKTPPSPPVQQLYPLSEVAKDSTLAELADEDEAKEQFAVEQVQVKAPLDDVESASAGPRDATGGDYVTPITSSDTDKVKASRGEEARAQSGDHEPEPMDPAETTYNGSGSGAARSPLCSSPILAHPANTVEGSLGGRVKAKLPIRKGISLDHKAREQHHHHHNFHFNLRRANTRCGSHPSNVCGFGHHQNGAHLSELLVVQDLSKKQQMDSRRQVVIMLAFVVACFFLLFFPYRVFTIWLILSTEDQVQSLGMETYYNLTYFSRILIYLHSAINPIAYNLISTKFRRAFMSILLCRGSSTRRHFVTEHRIIQPNNKLLINNSNNNINGQTPSDNHNKQQRQQLGQFASS